MLFLPVTVVRPLSKPLHFNYNTTAVPSDVLVQGTCIVNGVMLSGESMPLLKESIQLLDTKSKLDADGVHQTFF
jgi:hypothetical protein